MNNFVYIKIEPDLVIDDNDERSISLLSSSHSTNAADNDNNNITDDIKPKKYDNLSCCENRNKKFDKSEQHDNIFDIKCEPTDLSSTKSASPLVNDVERPTCNECGTMFKYKSQIKRHYIQVHSLEKPYKCDICQETFVDKYYIRNHMQRHGGTIKAYHCKICNKQFSHAFNIKKHSLVHSGLRPYKCLNLKCDKTYKHSSHLKRHMEHHEDGKDHWDTRPEGFVPEKKKRKSRTGKNIKKCVKLSKNVPMIDVIKELTDIFS